MNEQLPEWLARATAIAVAAGETVMPYYTSEVAVHIKGGDARDLVTDADLAADQQITSALREAFPSHTVLSEEAYSPGDGIDDDVPTWVVDPIDGTSNFAHRLPLFAISIGLRYQGKGLVGVIHAPALGWTFSAAAAHGANWNGLPMRVSHREQISRAIAACDWARQPVRRRLALAAHGALAEEAHTMRSMGSAALGLAAVAVGWVDIYFNYSLAPWDIAAGELLVHEAGGKVTTLTGTRWDGPEPSILATNGALHAPVLDLLTPFRP